MRTHLLRLAGAAAAAAGVLLAVPTPAPAGGRDSLRVLRIRVGTLEPDSNRFLPLRGAVAPRDAVVLVKFSAPVDLETVDFGTIRVRSNVEELPGYRGDYYLHQVVRWGYARGGFVATRTYENRVLFDPLGRWSEPEFQNPYGYSPFSFYTVAVPGIEDGHRATVLDLEGRPVRKSAERSFRTGDGFAGP